MAETVSGALQPYPSNTNSQLPPPRSSSRENATQNGTLSERRAGSASEQGAIASTEPGSKKSQLDVPGSSKPVEGSTSGTGLSGETVSSSAESIGRGSKRSLTGKIRTASKASSKRSQEPKGTTTGKPSQAERSVPVAAQNKSKKSPVSRFFSALNCCAAPEQGNFVGEEENTEGPKQANKLRSNRATQPAPAKKQDASAAESSTADSKDPMDEKSTDPTYPAQAAVATERRDANMPPQGDAPADKGAVQPSVEPSAASTKYSGGKKDLDQPLPPLPMQAGRVDTNVPTDTGSPAIAVQAPTPVVSQEDEQLIHDRTPEQEQKDTDIEMTDAGPSIPIATNDVPSTRDDTLGQANQRDATAAKIDLPPPPPLADRQAQTGAAAAAPTATQSQDTSLAVAPTETTKSLLPAIRPEHAGRKCLVLDLDETLVHSSFKILHQADFTIPVEIEGQYHNVYVIKRPGVDAFMKRVGELYEVVVFTASVSKVCSDVLDV